MVERALLLFLVIYAGLFAATGFVLFVGRGLLRRPPSNVALLRTASTLAFVLALVVWVFVILTG